MCLRRYCFQRFLLSRIRVSPAFVAFQDTPHSSPGAKLTITLSILHL